MRITDPNQICSGMEIFCVDGFTGSTYACHITRVEIVDVSIPSDNKPQGPKTWMRVKRLALYDDITSIDLNGDVWEESDSCKQWIGNENTHSMQDAGIIQNTYNKHQTFTTLEDAKLYGKGKLLGFFDIAPGIGLVCDYDRAMRVI